MGVLIECTGTAVEGSEYVSMGVPIECVGRTVEEVLSM
jgi:hypothetical protein